MFKLSCARHSSTSPMAKKMLSLEEMETQLVLELPDRQVMRVFDIVRDCHLSEESRGLPELLPRGPAA